MKRNYTEQYEKAKQSINMSNTKQLIKKSNDSIIKIGMNVGAAPSTLYDYLKNTTLPSVPVLINLADYFNCNIDYLIGRTNNPISLKDLDRIVNDKDYNYLIEQK